MSPRGPGAGAGGGRRRQDRSGQRTGGGQGGRGRDRSGDAPASRGRAKAGRGGPGVGADRGRAERSTGRSEQGLGGTQIEGRHAVREALAAGTRRVRDVWIADGVDPAPIIAEIESLALDAGVPVRRVGRTRLEAEAGSAAPQGVLARAAAVVEHDLADLAQVRPGGGPPFLLVLDGVTDPGNVGALLRTAHVAGATGVVLPRHRSAHLTPAAVKAAAGAVEHLRFALVPGIPAALSGLSDLKVWTVGLDASGDTSVFALELATEPIALVLGAEGDGLSRLARERCDVLARIPQHGSVASLNVAAAGAVACFEVARRRGAD